MLQKRLQKNNLSEKFEKSLIQLKSELDTRIPKTNELEEDLVEQIRIANEVNRKPEVSKAKLKELKEQTFLKGFENDCEKCL